MDAQVPDRGQAKRKRPAPREPMQGGSDQAGLGDDVAVGAVYTADACDCGGFPLLKLSFLLTVAALLVPASAARPVGGLIRSYQRLLTRFTPACPSSPSCSAYALTAVQRLGARHGLAAAAARVRACGARRAALTSGTLVATRATRVPLVGRGPLTTTAPRPAPRSARPLR